MKPRGTVSILRSVSVNQDARAWWGLVPDENIIASADGTGLSRCVAFKACGGSEALVYFPQPDLVVQLDVRSPDPTKNEDASSKP